MKETNILVNLSHLHSRDKAIIEDIEREIKDQIGFGNIGFSDSEGNICVELDDILTILKNYKIK